MSEPNSAAVGERHLRLYRRLLYLAPRRVREVYGPEMESLFAQMLSASYREKGPGARARLWMAAVVDLLRARFERGAVPPEESPSQRRSVAWLLDLRDALRSVLRSPGFHWQ